MNAYGFSLPALLLATGLIGPVGATERLSPPPVVSIQLAQGSNDSANPYNSPIRRANPNSRQGSAPATPPVRGPSTAPVPRAPTLENGGIGNGYPRAQPQPRAIEPGTPRQHANDRP